MANQITNTLMMVRPVNFGFNTETAVNNYYQDESKASQFLNPQELALEEFDVFVKKLRNAGVEVIVVEDTKEPYTPDSIFPNNWVSFHADGGLVLYPMYAENRRLERRKDLNHILNANGLLVEEVHDLTESESRGVFLEGTGSMILDRQYKKVYACISERTDQTLLNKFCDLMDYIPIAFTSNQTVDGKRMPIYHTNVMMCVADDFAIICLDSIDSIEERALVIEALEEDDKEIIEITEEQVEQFAGNMLQVMGNEKYLVMSESAHSSLTKEQIDSIEKHCKILSSPLETIETLGGGSARCMMAEVFLPKSNL